MTVTLKPVTLSIREIEMGVLKESEACQLEDKLIGQYGSNTTDLVVLHTNALAKKWLGIFGVSIGNDPRRMSKLGLLGQPKRDFDGERKFYEQLYARDPETLKHELANLRRQQEWAEQADSDYDADAWRALLEVQSWIDRRCVALDELGLIVFNGDLGCTPEDVIKDEAARPDGQSEFPWEGTVQLTEKGRLFVGRGQKLRPRKDQPSHCRHVLDQLLEVY